METRTKKEVSEATLANLLDVAPRLFLEKGYHATSIDDITQAAGLTKGALYWHFKSKEDLLDRILKEFETKFLDALVKEVKQVKEGGLARIQRMFRFSSVFAYHNRELCVSFTTLAAELVGAHHKMEPKIRRIYKRYQTFLSGLIADGKRDGTFDKDFDDELAALTIMAMHDGTLLHWSMNRDRIDGEKYFRVFQKMLLHGLTIRYEGVEKEDGKRYNYL
jgi:AcrR family transcriptional regulator